MRRVLWDDYSPLWEQEVRKRPLKEVFEQILSPRSDYHIPASILNSESFIRNIVLEYTDGRGGPGRFYQDYDNYGLGMRIVAGNLFSMLLLDGIVLPHEKLEGMDEYRTREGTVYRYKDGRNEVIKAD